MGVRFLGWVRMSNKEKQYIEPILRFLEFKNTGGWRNIQLINVLIYERPENYIVSNTNYKSSGVPVLTANKSFILGYTNETQNIYGNLPVIIFDDFTTDKKYVDFAFKIKSSAIKILTVKGRNNLKVIFELINQIQFNADQHKRYYISEYQNLFIPLPTFEEQQKIADCLSSIDELITAENKKLDTLKTYKKGLMQQLFPAEGETIPKIRFPEFHNYPVWKIKQLDELLCIGNGRDYKHLSKGIIPVYGTGGYMLSVNDYLYDGESVCIGRKGTIDKPTFLTGKFWTVDTLFYTHSFKKCLPKFIYLLFQNIAWLNYNAASGVPSLSKTTIEKIKVPTPTLEEQQKIADCLSFIDELITAERKKLDILKNHKKGLVQQIFPIPEDLME